MKKQLVGLMVAAVVLLVPVSNASAALNVLQVRVQPSTGLTDGQVVAVKGRGFTSGANIVVAQCVAGAVTADDCDIINVVFTVATASGSFALHFPVATHMTTTNQGRVKCNDAPGACLLVGANFDNQTEATGVPISFGA